MRLLRQKEKPPVALGWCLNSHQPDNSGLLAGVPVNLGPGGNHAAQREDILPGRFLTTFCRIQCKCQMVTCAFHFVAAQQPTLDANTWPDQVLRFADPYFCITLPMK